MVPKEFRKNFCVIAGWVSLLEALVWAAASIFSVGVYECSWDYYDTNKGANTWSMLYVTYFMGSCKGVQGSLDTGFVLSPPSDPARHLHVWMFVYTVGSVAWIPTCVLLTVAASTEVRGRQGALLYYPWITLSSIFIIVDLAGAVYYFIDILHTTTPDDYASLTANSSWTVLTLNSPSDGITTWLPSLLVTLFFCRFLILWVINIFFLYGVYKGCNAVSLYTTKYLQSSLMPEENKKSWKTRFYEGPDPSLFEQRGQQSAANGQSSGPKNMTETQRSPVLEQQRHEERRDIALRYRMDDFGIPIEEIRPSNGREVASDQIEQNRTDRGPRSPLKAGVFDYSGRPVRSDSFKEHWRDNAPPIASGVQVPPELNKFEPFSYTAGDQPQRMRRPLSRSNSRGEQPPIPRPDYTIADRRAASLEYVPNRFRVPSPKRPLSQSSMNFDSSPGGRPLSSPKVPPSPPKKPTIYPRSIPEDAGVMPESRYISQQAVPNQQPNYYTRQASTQSNNYNINKLY